MVKVASQVWWWLRVQFGDLGAYMALFVVVGVVAWWLLRGYELDLV